MSTQSKTVYSHLQYVHLQKTYGTHHTVIIKGMNSRADSHLWFLRATSGTAIARRSRRNSVCLSVTRVDQAKTVQARIIKSSPSAAPKTLVLGSVTLFPKIP